MGFRELVFLQSFCLFICFWILTEFPSSTLHHPKDFRYHTAADNSETTCFDLCLIPRSSAPDRSVLYVTCLIPACLCIQHKKKKKKKLLFIQLLQSGNLWLRPSILGSVWLLSQYGTLLLPAFPCWSTVVAIGNHSLLLTCSHYVAEVLNSRWKYYSVVICKQYTLWASSGKLL